MPEFFRKYATATHIQFPMIKRGVVDFAVGADWTPAAGDVKISIDGGAAASTTNLPTAIAMGNTAYWDLSLTTGELTGKKIMITIGDAATKAVEDQAASIITYGNASAEWLVDPTDSVRFGMSALPNAAAEAAGGLYTRGSGAGQINQNANGQVDTRWVGGNVTVATNNDKAGYTLSSAGIQSIFDFSTTLLTTVGSFGKLIVDNINATISSRLPTASYVNPLDAAGTRTAIGLATANLDTQLSGLSTGISALPTANANADALLDRSSGVESGWTLRQLLRLWLAGVAGPRSGFATSTPLVQNPAGTKNRLTGVGIDVDGNGTWTTDVT